GLNFNDIQIVDGSGASMNDYVTADFMTSALKIISKSNSFNNIKNSMTDTNIGTFKGRLPELNGKLKVKTGTNANTSGVVGYMETKSGKSITFAVMLDNLPKNVNSKKFENEIIKSIYNEF
ncbi:MAG: D-alanyl-D-alanine carboxypeptidase, partial [Candidatus Gastranaerophilales bacterium]|nr:D-alanyl-D-alanine carboxypeptidase [Candidatus Gastranaerophilales bacterium]